MNKIHALIIVRNHSDFLRLHPIITELSWTSRVIDLSQLSAALVTRRFDWVVAIDIPIDCEHLLSFLNHLEESIETKNVNFINVHHNMIDVSHEKLKSRIIDLYQQFFWITYGDGGTHVSLSETLTASIRCGHSRFQAPTQAKQIAIYLSQLTSDPERTYLGLWEIFTNIIEHGTSKISEKKEAIDSKNQCLEKITSKHLINDEDQNKYVYISFLMKDDSISFDVNGIGFNWSSFLTSDSDQISGKNGYSMPVDHTIRFDKFVHMNNGTHIECQIKNYNS